MKQMPFYRIIRIVWMAMTFFIQYTSFQIRYRGYFTPSIQQKWDRLVTKQAKSFKKLALELGGLTIKIGQFLSARADIMPPSFIEEMEGLTDQVTPIPHKKALAFLDDEIGQFLESGCISTISDTPIASASIGDVYKGQLADGTAIAIKVQRANIEKILRADFKALKMILWFIQHCTTFGKQLNLDLLYKEMTHTIGAELNYLEEIKNGQQFSKRFADRPGVRFPVYFKQYSTTRVLVMEWIEGTKITNLEFLEQHNIDRQALAERLFRFFLDQILEGGQVHADPYSGNILIQSDGTIAIIDFGMTITISEEEAAAMLLIMKSVLFGQYDRVVDGLEQLNFLLDHADRHAIAEVVKKTVKAYEAHDLQDINGFAVNQLLKDLQEIIRTQHVQLPAEFAFLGRAVSIFTGLLHAIYPTIDLLAIAKPQVVAWGKKQTIFGGVRSKKEAEQAIFQTIGKIRNIAQKAFSFLEEPERMRNFLETRSRRHYRQRVHIQTRQFTGMVALIFLSFTFIGIWLEHTNLMLIGGIAFILTGIIFWRQAKRQ